MRATFLITTLVFAIYCLASEPYRVDVRQEAFAEQTSAIDHLEPVRGTVPEYDYLAQFIELPSFDRPAYLAAVKTQQGRYVLRVASLPARWRPSEGPKRFAEVEIPESLAEVIYELWVNSLLEVRYDKKWYKGMDGVTYTFSTFVRGSGFMHGSIWSPDADLPPQWLVDSAHQLMTFARDPKRDAKKIEAQLITARDKLFEYFKKQGKH